jgi:excisionase family DNA binding protein
MTSDPSKLLTVDQAARRLTISPRSVRRFAATGRLASVRIGRSYRFTRAVVEQARALGC